jgi:hypothetical protein
MGTHKGIVVAGGKASFDLHEDGEMIVEIDAGDVGDSETGWQSATGIAVLSVDEVAQLRKLLGN